jgi:hypothetical protein
MKKIILIMTILVFSLLLLGEGTENLSNDINHWAKHPVIEVMVDGNIICLWGEGEEERIADIAYRILDTTTWKWGPKLAAVRHIYAALFPQICEDSEGVIHMSYMDGNARQNRDIWYTSYDYRKPTGQRWSRPEMLVRTREQSAWQRISIDPIREDLYVTWQHVYEYAADPTWHSNVVVYKKTKNQVTGEYGLWEGPVKMSRNIQEVDIHQATVVADGKLHAVYEEGHEAAWTLRYNYLDAGATFKEARDDTVRDLPGGAPPSYWCELDADSEGNLYCVYSRRTNETKAAFKPVGEEWQDLGPIIRGSLITMIGLKVARNDVAYAIHNQGYHDPAGGSRYRPVFVRFTHDNISTPTLVRDSGTGQRVLEIDVDDNGTAHCVWAGPYNRPKMDIHYERVPQPVGGPRVKLNVPEILLTNEDVTLQGEVTSSTSPIVNHRFYIRKLKLWGGGDTPEYTVRFTKEGFYTIHYYVSDSNNYMGHTAVTVEVLDAPFQPTDVARTTEIVRGMLFRAWVTKFTWNNDSRNDGKFDNLTHFNIYRRNTGESWGAPVTQIPFTDSATTYEYLDPQAFVNQNDAESIQYAITAVADVSGFEKESKKTIL